MSSRLSNVNTALCFLNLGKVAATRKFFPPLVVKLPFPLHILIKLLLPYQEFSAMLAMQGKLL